MWLACISALFGHAAATPTLAVTANIALAFAAAAKWQYWRVVRGLPAGSTIGSATGLDRLGAGARVHALDPPPHRAQLAAAGDGLPGGAPPRRTAARARLGARVPRAERAVRCRVVSATLRAGAAVAIALGLAAVSASAGILVERWLFFAEAEHKMTLYYGSPRV